MKQKLPATSTTTIALLALFIILLTVLLLDLMKDSDESEEELIYSCQTYSCHNDIFNTEPPEEEETDDDRRFLKSSGGGQSSANSGSASDSGGDDEEEEECFWCMADEETIVRCGIEENPVPLWDVFVHNTINNSTCIGTILNEKYILSSSECYSTDQNANDVNIQFTDIQQGGDGDEYDFSVDQEVVSVEKHPDWDVALYEIEEFPCGIEPIRAIPLLNYNNTASPIEIHDCEGLYPSYSDERVYDTFKQTLIMEHTNCVDTDVIIETTLESMTVGIPMNTLASGFNFEYTILDPADDGVYDGKLYWVVTKSGDSAGIGATMILGLMAFPTGCNGNGPADNAATQTLPIDCAFDVGQDYSL
eukprot:UN23718